MKWCPYHIVLLCLCLQVTAQNRFEHFTTDHGLSQNTILSIIQDRTGYIWIGTEDGLNRFDGYTFKKYYTIPGDSTSLPDDQVWSLLEDSKGRIWIGHTRGISYFDFSDQKFHNVLLENNLIVSTSLQDSKGNLWFGTTGGGLVQISGDELQVSRFQNSIDPIAPYDLQAWAFVSNYIISIYEYGNDLLIGTRGAGLFRFHDNEFDRIKAPTAFERFFSQNDVRSIFRGSKGEHYVGTTQGLGIFSSDFSQGQLYLATGEPHALSSNRISRLCMDGENGLWVSTYGEGLNYFDFRTKHFTVYKKTSDPASLSSDLAFSVLIDRNQNVWAGTWAGGLNKLNRNVLRFSTYDTNTGIGDSYIASIASKGDSILVGTYSSGLYLIKSDGSVISVKPDDPLALNYIRSVSVGSRVWVGLDGGGIAYTDTHFKSKWKYYRRIAGNENSLNNHLVSVVLEDKAGNLWVGTHKSGLKRIYPRVEYGQPGCIQHFNSFAEDSTTLSDDVITSLFLDSLQYLWVGTRHGLNRSSQPIDAEKVSNEFIRYGGGAVTNIVYHYPHLWVGTETGLYKLKGDKLVSVPQLAADYINAIVPDRKKVLWISTNRGIVSVYPQGRLQRFTRLDGLQSNEFNLGVGRMTPGGKIFFGGVNGLNAFYPEQFETLTNPPEVSITKILLNNKEEINYVPGFQLKNTDKIIEFEFATLDYTNPYLNEYQYRLEGFDNSWNTTSAAKRTATYTNLGPGKYAFKVRGSNSQGIWSDDREIVFTVLPPFWRTWWAYLLYSLILAAIIFTARKSIVNRERLKARLRLEHLEIEKLKELDEFKSKFFANISHEFRTPLTLILGHAEALQKKGVGDDSIASINHNSKAVLELVNQMLDLSRIDAGKLSLHPANIDLNEFLKMRVQVFQSLARQKNLELQTTYATVNATVSLDPAVVEKIINNLISNAIKYTAVGGTICFTAQLDDQVLQLTVEDTGIGIAEAEKDKIFQRFYRVSEDTPGTGIGLALTQELVKLHNGTIEVESEAGKGSKFTVRIPILVAQVLQGETIVEEQRKYAGPPVIDWPDATPAGQSLAHVLVVEDNEELRKFLKQSLHEFDVFAASHADEGLQYAIQYVPDIIITDWMMPGKSGIELCKELKSHEATSHVPVIMLTAKAGLEPKLEGLETGADDYLTKPFEMQELKTRLKNLITQRSKLREKFSKVGLHQYKQVKVSSLDERFIERFYNTLEKNISNAALSVESLSREMGVSRVQLHRKLSALFGHAASDLIRDYRLQRAADLLRQKSGNVSEIAFQVGFENLSYFTKAFKHKYEVTPSEYL